MVSFQQSILDMESAIASAEGGDTQDHLKVARECLERAIVSICKISTESPKRPLSELIDEATKNINGRRESAILIVRTLSVDGLLPFKDDRMLELKVVELVEAGFIDQCRGLQLEKKRQTFEKINALKGLHESICAHLHVLKELESSPDLIDTLLSELNFIFRG